MAELEDVTLDGKPLHSLRVADLKAALEQRGLPKSGQKNALIKRLKGALMLENLQRTSTPHVGLQPNSQIGEEMSQNSFIKQYLAKQQELLRQRLEREAREAAEADGETQSTPQPPAPEEEDHTEGNNISSCPVEEQSSVPSRTIFGKPEGDCGDEMMTQEVDGAKDDKETALPSAPLSHPAARRTLIQHASERQMEASSAFTSLAPEPGPQEASEVPRGRSHRSSSSHLTQDQPSTLEAATGAAPLRAVASLSVRVVGDHAKEGSAQPGSATSHSTPQHGWSTRASTFGQADSEEEEDSDEDEDWSIGVSRRGASRGPPHSNLQPLRERSRRKQQPPQHIPPPQLAHQPPLQLRQPTPPPSPPPELSFPLPDTPKQSPPGPDEPEGAAAAATGRAENRVGSPHSPDHQESSSSSSSSSSPEPSHQRRPGPLTLLALKMESEGAFASGRERSRSEDDEQRTVSASDVRETASPAADLPGDGNQERTVSTIVHAGSMDSLSPSSADLPTVVGMKSETAMESTAIDPVTPAVSSLTFSSEGPAPAKFVAAAKDDLKEEKEPPKLQEEPEQEPLRVVEPNASEEREEEDAQDPSLAAGGGRKSCIPLWKRGREFVGPASSTVEKVELLVSQPPGRQSEPPESQTATSLSPQPPSKKFRFRRDFPSSSPPASPPSVSPTIVRSAEIPADVFPAERQPGLISPSPDEDDQSRSVDAKKGGVPPKSLAPASEKSAVPGMQLTDPASQKVREAQADREMLSEMTGSCSESENRLSTGDGQALVRTCKPAEDDQPGKPVIAEAPVGPVLPPSPPPEEGDVERERGRSSISSSSSSSSDSDTESSSSRSSESSSSSKDKSHSSASSRNVDGTNRDTKVVFDTPSSPCRKRKAEQQDEEEAGATRQSKKSYPGQEGADKEQRLENKGIGGTRDLPASELKQAAVSEPAESAMQVDTHSQSEDTGVQPRPDSHGAPESNEGRSEESAAPKSFTARKISLNTASKASVCVGGMAQTAASSTGPVESETGGQAARKRRWGSSTVVTAKKPSISITTDSLKSLIPDIKPATGPGAQEAIVDLHPDEGRLSGDEEAADRGDRGDQGLEKGLKIRRTVTQVVPAENQENGQKDKEDEEEGDEERETERAVADDGKAGSSEVTLETQALLSACEADLKKVTPSDALVRRSISQQKSGVSITIDDPVRVNKQPSPPRGKITNIVHICNLVRPFTLGQLKELLNRTGTVMEEGFWIDKIKSHCYVTYSSTEEAVSTRAALHGVKWPQSNPKFLKVDFAEQEELDFHRGLLTAERSGGEEHGPLAGAPPGPSGCPGAPPSLMAERQQRDRERDRGSGPVRDQWAEREREMERRERTRAEREWDRDKVRDFGKPGEDRDGGARRSRSRDRERRRKERAKSKEKKTEKKEKAPEEPPAKLLDDLFCKTKTAPCIYWLPLTAEQAAQRGAERAERMKEREKRRKELQEEEDKKREEERKERMKGREKEAGGVPSAGAGGAGRVSESERERGRDREGDKRRDSYRARPAESKPEGGAKRGPSGGWRSRSRSNPPSRDRRR
ncbi:apoptotic chromatin condensation inducer in the nucleus-like [Arapaima gigas]